MYNGRVAGKKDKRYKLSSLKQKSVSGVLWAVTEKFGIYGVKLVLGIVLARLLTPEAFGLVGMITVFFSISEVFVNSGFSMAYIQKKTVNEADADTVFYTNLGISVLLYLILFFGAPVIANFYEEPLLVDLTRVMAFVVIINSFNIIQRAQIKRDVNFKKLTKITVISTISSGVIGVSAAYFGMGVWALVMQSLANRTFIAVGFWSTTNYKPRWRFSKSSFKQMFSFGSWMLISSIIRKVFDNIYILTIGKFFPAAQLGFYTKAKQFQRMASQNIAGAIGDVAFPVYSKLQDDKEKLQNAMRKFLQQSMFFMVPLLLGLIVVAKPFVIVLLKEKWAPMIPYLQLLCIIGILYPLHLINVQALVAQGKSKLSFKLGLIKNGLRVLNIFITYRFGIVYIILGEIVVSFIGLWINTWYNYKFLSYGLWKQFKDFYSIIIVGIFTALITYAGTYFFIDKLLIVFIMGIITFALVYAGLSYIINRKLFYYTLGLLKDLKNNR